MSCGCSPEKSDRLNRENEFRTKLGENLRGFRLELGWSRATMAKKICDQFGQIGSKSVRGKIKAHEDGTRMPSVLSVLQYCTVLGVSLASVIPEMKRVK